MREKIRYYTKKLLRYIKRLRLRKMHLDYIAGLLTIPVLITAIIINYSNLNRTNNTTQPKISPTPIVSTPTPRFQRTPVTPIATCQKTVGPVEISYPQEGQNVSDNPICITINYSNPNYCSVVWSYRINGGSWSAFSNNAPCLYNLPNENVQFQLQVDSTVSSDQQTFVRNFVYSGASNPTATPAPSSTPTPVQPTIASSSAH